MAVAAPPEATKYKIYVVEGSSAPTVQSVIARRHRLLAVHVKSAINDYFDLTLGNKPVGRFCYSDGDIYMVGTPEERFGGLSGLEYLLKILGLDQPIADAAQDEDIVLSNVGGATGDYVFETIRDWEGDLASRTVPGGSDAYPRPFIFWLTHSATINKTGWFELDTAYMFVGAPKVVSGTPFPRLYKFTLYTIVANGASNGSTVVDEFRIKDEDEELWNTYSEPIPVEPGANMFAFDYRYGRYFRLPELYPMLPDHRFTIEIHATYDGTNTIDAGTFKLGLVGVLEKA